MAEMREDNGKIRLGWGRRTLQMSSASFTPALAILGLIFIAIMGMRADSRVTEARADIGTIRSEHAAMLTSLQTMAELGRQQLLAQERLSEEIQVVGYLVNWDSGRGPRPLLAVPRALQGRIIRYDMPETR